MITVEHNFIETNWVSPPSESILRLVYEKDINLNLFRNKLNFSPEEFINLLHDKIEITSELASKLSNVLGGSQLFWLNRYLEFKTAVVNSNRKILSENYEFLESLSKIRSIHIDNLLNDFKVSTYENLIVDYLNSPKILYSRSQRIEPSPVSIANWVRKCEFIAENIIVSNSVPIFSASKLKVALGDILALTKVNSVMNIIPKLKSILFNVGVILVLSPSEVGHGVSGFTKTLFRKYRLVVVTDRYKNNAAFWFTLLHELAHCVLHQIKQTLIHYSDDEFLLASLQTNDIYEEQEANNFVEELIFPNDFMSELYRNNDSYKNIMKLGVKYDISTALIVAQIHREKLAPYNFFRKVFRRVEFDTIF